MDEFEDFRKGLTSPATMHFAITPDDDNDLPVLPRVIYCRAQGMLLIRGSSGVELPYEMIVGERLDFRGIRVMSIGTTGIYYGWP